jgi:hypothetical protein
VLVTHPALNHFVTKSKAVRTCIFEVGFSHNACKIEQAGIEFITATDKHTNVRRSNGDTKHNAEHMYYCMILVLDPDFSAEEIRDANSQGPPGSQFKPGPAATGQCMGQPALQGSGVPQAAPRAARCVDDRGSMVAPLAQRVHRELGVTQ